MTALAHATTTRDQGGKDHETSPARLAACGLRLAAGGCMGGVWSRSGGEQGKEGKKRKRNGMWGNDRKGRERKGNESEGWARAASRVTRKSAVMSTR